MSVSEFKAKCLALFDEVGRKGSTITVTRRGRPLAMVGPVRKRLWKSSEGVLAGKVSIPDDVLMADQSHLWDVVRQKRRSRQPEPSVTA